MVATGRKTRGGITSVVKAHETGEQWQRYHCHWVQTHRDGAAWRKIWYFATALVDFMFRLPFCDIVHIHFSTDVSAMRKMVFFRLAKLAGKKVIVHFHACSAEMTIHGKRRHMYEYLFSKADRVIALSEYWQKEICDEFGLSKEKVVVVYNPCPVISAGAHEVEKEKTILYAGTVNERKGYADMIRAFAKIAARFPDWRIVFAGNGEVEQGKALARELGIESQTEFLGWVSGDDKDRAFRSATVFCLPSYAEGFPMAVLDAWAYGLPVITTPVGGIPDVAKDGENMLLFEPGEVGRLAEQMERMITDSTLREMIARASVDFARKEFNIQTINREIGEMYSSFGTRSEGN